MHLSFMSEILMGITWKHRTAYVSASTASSSLLPWILELQLLLKHYVCRGIWRINEWFGEPYATWCSRGIRLILAYPVMQSWPLNLTGWCCWCFFWKSEGILRIQRASEFLCSSRILMLNLLLLPSEYDSFGEVIIIICSTRITLSHVT